MHIREIATGLHFPEGPIAMPDGTIILVEIAAGTLTRIDPKGRRETIAVLGGGPNGAAIGPDGACYICNNGGMKFTTIDGKLYPGLAPDDYKGGWIERVELSSGASERLYTHCGDLPLRGPNDLVFDAQGGFWFTDHGKTFRHSRDRGAVYYARNDGTSIQQVIFPLDTPNGIGLSPDGKRLYVAETHAGRIWSFEIESPGRIKPFRGALPWQRGELLIGLPGHQMLDSLAVDEGGYVCAATIGDGGITSVSPTSGDLSHVPLPDSVTTNICFGGRDRRTAYCTLSSTGRIVAIDWPRPGLALHFAGR